MLEPSSIHAINCITKEQKGQHGVEPHGVEAHVERQNIQVCLLRSKPLFGTPNLNFKPGQHGAKVFGTRPTSRAFEILIATNLSNARRSVQKYAKVFPLLLKGSSDILPQNQSPNHLVLWDPGCSSKRQSAFQPWCRNTQETQSLKS